MVREGFQDVVLCFNLLINILKKYKDSQSAHVYQQLLILDKKEPEQQTVQNQDFAACYAKLG